MKAPVVNEVSRLEAHTGYWLRFLSNAVSHRFARKLEGVGVTVAEWVLLREMYEATSCAPSALASRTGLSRGAVSKLVDRLLGKGLLTRAVSERDRRYQDVALTADGRHLVPRLAAIADENDRAFFSRLSAPERARLSATLRKLVAVHRLSKIPVE